MFVGRWIRCLNVEEPSRLLIRRLVCLIRRLEAASTLTLEVLGWPVEPAVQPQHIKP